MYMEGDFIQNFANIAKVSIDSFVFNTKLDHELYMDIASTYGLQLVTTLNHSTVIVIYMAKWIANKVKA